ncbi:hypothetical protein M951_chr3175 (nucleomorph) [Lotharella oceanica]|uniref:Uncharacterized protein n=1 Tax=Lotharella oceanica TaxID=641309 RepID=A0A060DGF0_9EUKA|nr:hypothetical protein M951_chr130 [Lotharella oceanica]AIB09680.1 hypothetical protein M951_chr1201 [Lotharella oceanica]AIB09733.1 hypothetical protein M951_chr230 [Lotharella oceanica]AIB09883.1 hypothetical protein M951_chr2191 [Lotharella oceanica]AIB09936.1 hypothetical protein M951_chr330 [Lotharella oceanica]
MDRLSSAAKDVVNNIGHAFGIGGHHHRDNFGCDEGCRYMELVKDFRGDNRNFVGIALVNKNEQESRYHSPYDWCAVHVYNYRSRGQWRGGSSGDWQIWFGNKRNTDFRLLRRDGEVYSRDDQEHFINLDDFLNNKNNTLHDLSQHKFNLIKELCVWDYGSALLSHVNEFQDPEDRRHLNPNQIDNFIQDAFLIRLVTDHRFFVAYKSLHDDLAHAFVENFVARIVCTIIKAVHDGATNNNHDVRGLWVIRYYGPNPTIDYYKDMLKHMQDNDNFRFNRRFREDPTPIISLRGSNLVKFW